MPVTVSARVAPETAEQLQELAQTEHHTVSEIISRAVEEYVRSARFPGIAFITSGNRERKAKLLGGPDVWAVVFTARNHDMDLEKTADYLSIHITTVQLALSYYAAYPEEIDARLRWIEETDEDPTLLHPAIRVVDVSEREDATAP